MLKRTTSTDRDVSPPPVRRKLDSTTESKGIANFFTPVSKKQPDDLIWSVLHETVIRGRFKQPENQTILARKPVKVAAFDLDDTVISPKTGNRYERHATSWKWWDNIVPDRLRQLHSDGYLVVILSNQGAISLKNGKGNLPKETLSSRNFKAQVSSILIQLDFPISVYAATGNDMFRKPRPGMWEQLKLDHGLKDEDINMSESFYIGDAAGREQTDKRRKDHATSDRYLALNIGIPFETPEEFFLAQRTESYTRCFEPEDFLKPVATSNSPQAPFTKQDKQELVVFCGSPGAGKSSFFWKILEPQGYERVNQDILKTRQRCIKRACEHLNQGLSVAVDNTNRDREARAHWVNLAREYHIPVRCIHFTASAKLCEHNDVVRALNDGVNPEKRTMLPPIAFRSFAQSYIEPSLDEGFQDITKVQFTFEGTEEEKQNWSKYWVSKFST